MNNNITLYTEDLIDSINNFISMSDINDISDYLPL